MKIVIIAVGTMKEKHYRAACAEYCKRLGPLMPVEVIEIPEEPLTEQAPALVAKALEKEGQQILRRTKEEDIFVPLTPAGQMLDSPAFARALDPALQQSAKRLVFAIGSSHGLDEAVLARGQWTLSFGPMTFPHQLARVMLLEQIYRGCMILAGRRYHK